MKKYKTLRVLLHFTGCLVFLALPIFIAPDFPESTHISKSVNTQRDLIAYALMICFFYLNFFLLIPKFYSNRKYFLFFSILTLCFIIISSLPHLILPEKNAQPPLNSQDLLQHPPSNDQGNQPPPPDALPNDGKNQPPPGGKPPHDLSHHSPPFNTQRQPPPAGQHDTYILISVHYLFTFLALVFFSLILQINNRLKRTEKEKLNTELLYLKAQINPHFLFNTLNTIYSLAVENSANTSTAVIRLSEMMRYVINETGKDFVFLKDEIIYINNYVALQKIRFGDTVNVSFETKGKTAGKKIAPLILIPFIENAFKYGVNAEEESIIKIKINIEESSLKLSVSNKKVNITPIESSGLGISNTESRLQLLYPGKHTLYIKNDENFSVSLSLDLS